MQRISSGRIAATAGAFDALAFTRQAAAGADFLAPVAEGLQAKAVAQLQLEERDASQFARLENARIDRELAGDLQEVRTAMPESGAGYANLAMQATEKRYQEARARAGNDPLKLKKLDETYAIDKENRLASFQSGERDFSQGYALNQHVLSFDNAKQEVARAGSGVPSYDPTGISASAATAMSNLEASAGRSFKVTSAARSAAKNAAVGGAKGSQHLHGNAFDIDTSGMSKDERIAVIKQARAAGFGGIGVYDNSLHFDVGETRAWGPDYHSTSLPDWAVEAVGAERGALPDGHDHNGLPKYVGDVPDVRSNPVLLSHKNELFAQIDGMSITRAEKAELKRQAEGGLVMSALTRMGEENPSAALAALRSGQYDEVISYADDQQMQGGWSRLLDQQITKQAKAALDQSKAEATLIAADAMAWQNNGRQGDAPAALSVDQFALLSPEKQQSYVASVGMGDVLAQAHSVDLGRAAEWLETVKPQGEGYAGEKASYEAADRLIKSRQEAHDKAQKVIAARQEVEQVERHVSSSLTLGVAPDVTMKGVKTQVDKLFDLAIGAGGDPISAAGQFIVDRKVAPDRFGGMVAQAMASDNPALALQAVEAVAKINAADPRILANAPNGRAIDRAQAVASYMDLGVSAKEAFSFTLAMADPSKKPEIKARGEMWAAEKGKLEDQAYEAFVARIEKRGVDKGLDGDDAEAALPASVWGEYSDLVKENYTLTGNVEVAVAAAERAFFASHAITRVGGVPQWQKGAPEAFYSVWGDERDSDWIGEQAAVWASQSLGKPVKSVVLQPSGNAMRDKNPSYVAIALLDDGSSAAVTGLFRPAKATEMVLQAIGREAATAAQSAELDARQLAVDQRVALRALIKAQASNDFAALPALREKWQSFDPLIQEARKKSVAAAAAATPAVETPSAFDEALQSDGVSMPIMP